MKEQIAIVADAVREFLAPRWIEIHAEQDAGAWVPDIHSTHCCRESSVLGLIVLEALGIQGWRLQSGDVLIDKDDIEMLPLDVSDIHGYGIPDKGLESLAHTWLENDSEDLILDLTADQFGAMLVATADDALVADASSMRDVFVPGAEVVLASWMGEPDLLMRPLGWTKSHEFGELLAQLADDLKMEADLQQVRSVPPMEIYEAIADIRNNAFDLWMPTEPVAALEKIRLYKQIDEVLWARPYPEAREQASEVLRELMVTVMRDPEMEGEIDIKSVERLLLREEELVGRRESTSLPAP